MWKIIQTILNSKIFLYIVIAGFIWLYIHDRNISRKTINRLENNQTALAIQSSREIQVTRDEFKTLFPKVDSVVHKVIGSSKPSQVIVNNYHYKDTSIVEFPLTPKDSLKDTLQFVASIKCMSIKGEVINGKKVRLLDRELNDKLYTIVYQNYTKRFLGFLWKQKKFMDAITYSECTNDTMYTEKNIKIIKK